MNCVGLHRAASLAFVALFGSVVLARAGNCPDGYHQVGEKQEETADAIIIHPICAPNPKQTVPNLAKDPNAARLSAAALTVVDGRIANLQKAIALLSHDNPEWARERDQALDDMREDTQGLSWEGINLLSLGLAEWAKAAAASHLDDMRVNALVKAMKEPLADLPAEEVRLNRIMAETSDPALTQAILEYTAALHRLRDAENTRDVVTMAARTRDAVEALHAELELMRAKPPSSQDVADRLYVSSAMMGRVALIFVAEGPIAVAAATGSAASSLAVGGRELVNLWQERSQLAAMDQSASDRNRMRVELVARLDDLQQQHERLAWAVQHAQ